MKRLETPVRRKYSRFAATLRPMAEMLRLDLEKSLSAVSGALARTRDARGGFLKGKQRKFGRLTHDQGSPKLPFFALPHCTECLL